MCHETKSLIIAWGILMLASLAMGLAANVGASGRLSPYAIAGLMLIALIKTRIVLAHYLGLKVNPGALGGFTFAAGTTLLLVGAAFIVVRVQS